MSHSVTVSPRGCPRLEHPSPTLCQSRRHSVAAELFTIQSFSRACPIGHALDTHFSSCDKEAREIALKNDEVGIYCSAMLLAT